MLIHPPCMLQMQMPMWLEHPSWCQSLGESRVTSECAKDLGTETKNALFDIEGQRNCLHDHFAWLSGYKFQGCRLEKDWRRIWQDWCKLMQYASTFLVTQGLILLEFETKKHTDHPWNIPPLHFWQMWLGWGDTNRFFHPEQPLQCGFLCRKIPEDLASKSRTNHPGGE